MSVTPFPMQARRAARSTHTQSHKVKQTRNEKDSHSIAHSPPWSCDAFVGPRGQGESASPGNMTSEKALSRWSAVLERWRARPGRSTYTSAPESVSMHGETQR